MKPCSIPSTSLMMIVFMLCMVASPVHAELIINGGFETGDYTGWTTNFTPPDDAAKIIDESVFPGQGRIRTGVYSIDFSVFEVAQTAVISQTFNTNSGQSYDATLSFSVYAWLDRTASLNVEILGADGTTVLGSQEFVRFGINPVNSGPVTVAVWTEEIVPFIADGSVATIRISDTTINGAASDALLDNVSIVPEPGSISLLLVGVLAWNGRK
jgi:hypothetical protein